MVKNKDKYDARDLKVCTKIEVATSVVDPYNTGKLYLIVEISNYDGTVLYNTRRSVDANHVDNVITYYVIDIFSNWLEKEYKDDSKRTVGLW